MKANRLSKIVFSATLLAASGLVADRAEAQHVSVGVGISLPPLVFPAPPTLVALPGTYVYAVPDYYDAEIFFVDGYWWRPWNGRWYRSAYYDHGWGAYSGVPYFYSNVPRDWRIRYRDRVWGGHPWNYERVGYSDVQRNWSTWKRDRHWDRNWERTREVRSDSRGDRRVNDSYRGEQRTNTRSDQRYREHNNTERRGELRSPTPAATHNRTERRVTTPQHSAPKQSGKSSNVRSSGGANRSSGAHRSSGAVKSSGGNRGPSNVKSSGGGRSGQQHGGGGHGAAQQHGGGGGHGGGGHK